jgi:dTDP-4-amino-4,6-dideoxygalactose transaminase
MYRVGNEELSEIAKVLATKQLFRNHDPSPGQLQECLNFEREWAERMGRRYALLLSGGGTAALVCSLVGLGIGPGDEVIIPGYTFMATASAVLAVGAIPVLAEIDATLAMDPQDLQRKIGPHTRAVIPVHMMGVPCNMLALCSVARDHHLKVIEDCAQAHGGSFHGKRLGAWGDAGAFSFNDYKVIGCGDGGGLITDSENVFERALVYHDSGVTFRPIAQTLKVPLFAGLQFRATEIMGAIMRIQLRRHDGILSDLRRIRHSFMQELRDSPGISFAPSNDSEGDCGVSVTFRFDSEAKARDFARAEGVSGWLPIDTGRHVYCNWEPILEQRAGAHPALNPYALAANASLRKEWRKDSCPETLEILRRTVFVSVNPDWSNDDVGQRIDACRRAGRLS